MDEEEEDQITTCPVCWVSSSDNPPSGTTEATDPPSSAVVADATPESPI